MFFRNLIQLPIRQSRQAMEACEVIISEMGAELHDDLIQKLSVLRLHMDKIERSSYDPKDTRETMIKMQADFQGIVDSVRRISRRLYPVHTENDTFEKRVEMLCQNLETPGTIRINTTFNGTCRPLPGNSELYLLRIIQELVHNSFRHSAAWHVWVSVTWEARLLKIEVEDDGSGFAKINEFIDRLKKKHNTLRMRSEAIGASIKYHNGKKGLLATITLAG
jgi:signal transduction histidine kinase